MMTNQVQREPGLRVLEPRQLLPHLRTRAHQPALLRVQVCTDCTLGYCVGPSPPHFPRPNLEPAPNPLASTTNYPPPLPPPLPPPRWDVCRVLLPQGVLLRLERDKLRSNAKLKLCKHALCCGLAYIYGALIPFAWAHPIAFAVSDLAATLATDAAMGMLGLPLPL